MSKFQIKKMTKADVHEIFRLRGEFENYLQNLSDVDRETLTSKREKRFLRDGFGRKPAFQGLIAKRGSSTLGFIIFNLGYDPDEMHGRVAYVLDLFVTEKARRLGVGKALMKSVARICKKAGGIDIYFCVWKKNRSAFRFYNRLGAERINDMVWMDWPREKW